jgi:hypothetical protein
MSDPEKKSVEYSPGFDDPIQEILFHGVLESLIPPDEIDSFKAGESELGTEIEMSPNGRLTLKVYIKHDESNDSTQG